MKQHIVLGATGALGMAIVQELISEGKQVKAVVRNKKKWTPSANKHLELLQMDICDTKSISAVIQPGAVVYHCANVPYQHWQNVLPCMLDTVLKACRGKGNVLVFPGNVYGYGPFQEVPAPEDHPKAAQTKKGRLRNALEEKLLQAHVRGDVSVVIPRFPDFFGPGVNNRLMGPIFTAAIKGKRTFWPGNADVDHDLIFIRDAARASILLGSEQTTHGQEWHVPGAGPLTGRQFVTNIANQAGTMAKVSVAGRTLLHLAAIFNAEIKEFVELLYEFEQPLVLDGKKFTQAFPDFRFTPHTEAIRQTIDWFRKQSQSTL
ncbi:hypothetical protein GCM10010965_26840 [Caldalkalibacillus thermarum]|uniref:NAD-dependent epimerase/dehydratase family protein n=1 Tax=Caldalkalibacillus thermarum TaxID=296745 RepID=UPI00166A22FF|nr:NAD-dependent epimerase/dehydratase family protein [Caldalkalibacillus thermarum]GGK32548.1 hypothetical protein GCM10010965_26840 [Caldalkalibacillus thermarum]